MFPPIIAAWPGVSALPHFGEEVFPQWRAQPARQAVTPRVTSTPGDAPFRLNDAGVALVANCLEYAPGARPTASQALEHPYFADFCPRTPLPDPFDGRCRYPF